MIPDSLLGLLLFAIGVGPGYVFVRVAERREPRRDRSTLVEGAELFLVGAVSTTASGAVVLLVTELVGIVNLRAFLTGREAYFLANPFRVTVVALTIVLLAYLGAWVAALLIYRSKPPYIFPNSSVWYETVKDSRALGESVYTTVELLDGRIITGYLRSYSLDPQSEGQDLTLRSPIWASSSLVQDLQRVNADFLLIRGPEMRYVSFKAVADPTAEDTS